MYVLALSPDGTESDEVVTGSTVESPVDLERLPEPALQVVEVT